VLKKTAAAQHVLKKRMRHSTFWRKTAAAQHVLKKNGCGTARLKNECVHQPYTLLGNVLSTYCANHKAYKLIKL
jgi:hypothetical protein